MIRRRFALVVLFGLLVGGGCARNGQVIRSEAPAKPNEEKPVRINNAESRTVRNWDGGTN